METCQPLLIMRAQTKLTFVSDYHSLSTMPGNAQCMILHAWTSANVSQD